MSEKEKKASEEVIDIGTKPAGGGLKLKIGSRTIFHVRAKYGKVDNKEKINTCLQIIKWAHGEICIIFHPNPEKFTPHIFNVKNKSHYVFETKKLFLRQKPHLKVEFLTCLIDWCNWQIGLLNVQIVKDVQEAKNAKTK